MNKRYEILAINDEQSTCVVCGKIELKRVVWMKDQETGEILHVGTSCAANLQKISVKAQKQQEKDFEAQVLQQAKEELNPFKQAKQEADKKADQDSAGLMGVEKAKYYRHEAGKAYHEAMKAIAAKYNVSIFQL